MEPARPRAALVAALLRRGEGAAALLNASGRFDIWGHRFGILNNVIALRTISCAERDQDMSSCFRAKDSRHRRLTRKSQSTRAAQRRAPGNPQYSRVRRLAVIHRATDPRK